MGVDNVTQRREYGDLATYESLKRQLVGSLRGRVLEIGVGRGANFGLLPAGVDWVGIEPDRRMRQRLGDERVLSGTAEELPLPDESVDAVLSTVVLCSVRDQDRALAEIRRVLRPGGRLVFFEHVAARPGTWTRRAQEVLAPISRRIDHGCDPSRETWRTLQRQPFRSLDLRWFNRGHTPLIGGWAVA